MLNVICRIFCFIKEWADVFLIGVGLSAFILYYCQKRDQWKSAATELKDQITEIEEKIQALKNRPHDLSNITLYQLGPIITENMWQKHHSLLGRHLDEDDRRVIQRFYNSVVRVEQARLDLVKCLVDTWAHKSYMEQKIIAEHCMDNSPISNDVFSDKIDEFLQNPNVFTPQVCLQIIRTANDIQLLTGTATFDRLKKFSK